MRQTAPVRVILWYNVPHLGRLTCVSPQAGFVLVLLAVLAMEQELVKMGACLENCSWKEI